ncbi:MAG: hypothetical protein WCG98_03360 [bacterium]
MKKNLLALAALGASIALLAGCATTTPEVEEDTGAVVEETTTPTVDASDVATGTVDTSDTTTGTTTTPTAE